MMLPWPWARLEWTAVCAERRTYGSESRSALRFLLHWATRRGFVYVAFVIDAFARGIVGWRTGRTAHRDRPDAGLNLALAMMTVANDTPATRVVLEIGVRRQKA